MKSNTPHQHLSARPRSRSISPIAASVLLFFVIFSAYGEPCNTPTDVRDRWDLHMTQLDELIEHPGTLHVVDESIRTLRDNGASTLDVRVHLHGLFDEPIDRFEATTYDVDQHDLFLPRLEISEVLCRTGTPLRYARVRQRLVFRLLFVRRSYEYDIHYFVENGIDGGGALRVWWVLADARKGGITGIHGSWYFKPVHGQTKDYTYFAYALRTVFEQTGIATRTAVKQFGVRDAKRIMLAMRDDAARTSE